MFNVITNKMAKYMDISSYIHLKNDVKFLTKGYTASEKKLMKFLERNVFMKVKDLDDISFSLKESVKIADLKIDDPSEDIKKVLK